MARQYRRIAIEDGTGTIDRSIEIRKEANRSLAEDIRETGIPIVKTMTLMHVRSLAFDF